MAEDYTESMGRLVVALEAEGYPVKHWDRGRDDSLAASLAWIAWRALPEDVCVLELFDWQLEDSLGTRGVCRDSNHEVGVVDADFHSKDCSSCPLKLSCPDRKES